MENKLSVFDQHAAEYDKWYDKHHIAFQAELLALAQVVPFHQNGVEIGVGTGRFAQALHIPIGVEPAENMAKIAETRELEVLRATAENLPFEDEMFDFALLVTTVCFLEDLPRAFLEIRRILKSGGAIILGIIDKNSILGRRYEQQQSENKFYRDAHFHSTEEITALLGEAGFSDFQYWQTLTHPIGNIIEKPTPGFGKGSFVVIHSSKNK